MKKLAILLLLGAAAAFAVYKYVFKASTDYSTAKADLVLDFAKVNASFDANDTANLRAMADKVVSIKGIVTKADFSDTSGTIVIGDTAVSNTITCQIDKRHLDISKVKLGEVVNVKGLCNGYMLDDLGLGSDLQLKGCSVVQ
jgi:hypothetical protein